MAYLFALLALASCLSVEASLQEYLSLLELPPLCDACRVYVQDIVDLQDRDDQITPLQEMCGSFPSVLRSVSGWEANCNNIDNFERYNPIQYCASMGICPTECAYCETRAYTGQPGYHAAWDTETENGKHFCISTAEKYMVDFGACKGKADAWNGTDLDTEAFCTAGAYPCTDIGLPDHMETWEYALQECLDQPNELVCANGQVSRTYANVETQYQYVFADPCTYTEACVCDLGFVLDGDGMCQRQERHSLVSDGHSAPDGPMIALAMKSMAGQGSRKKRVMTNEALQAQIKLAQALHKKQDAQPIWDCTGQDWTYFTDSPVDGVTYTNVGVASDHEYYTLAVKQNKTLVTMAVNLNLWPEGQMMSFTVTVSMGDWILNPMNDQGEFQNLAVANEDQSLWGLKVDETNDNPDPLGVYKFAKFHSVANTNNGFSAVSQYMDEIKAMNSVGNPTAAYVKFGGGIDEAGEAGLTYLSEVPLNEMVPGESTLVGGLHGEVEYYIHADPAVWPEHMADLVIVRDEKGLLWEPNGGIGTNTRIWHFTRQLLPLEETYMRMHVAAECYNEVLGAIVMFCEVPSVTPSPTRTPTRTPSRSPSTSSTRSSTMSPSMSRSGSVTPSGTPAPSTQDIVDPSCKCLDYGDDNEFGITTLSLGNFSGSSDTEGRLFVCGNADLRSYSVSDGLPPDARVDLYVGGDLHFPTGRVYGGDIAYGGEAYLGTSVSQGMFNHTIEQNPGAYNCKNADIYYKAYSLNIGTKHASGETRIKDDGTMLHIRHGVQSSEVFNVNCTDLDRINKMEFHGIPMGQDVIVNWFGKTCNMTEKNIVPVNPRRVLFNFPEAEVLHVKTVFIQASILAPFATLIGSGGVIQGQTVVGNWEGSTQQNYLKCDACFNSYNPWLAPVFAETGSSKKNVLAPL